MDKNREINTVQMLLYKQALRERLFGKDVGTMETLIPIRNITTTSDPVLQLLREKPAIAPRY